MGLEPKANGSVTVLYEDSKRCVGHFSRPQLYCRMGKRVLCRFRDNAKNQSSHKGPTRIFLKLTTTDLTNAPKAASSVNKQFAYY